MRAAQITGATVVPRGRAEEPSGPALVAWGDPKHPFRAGRTWWQSGKGGMWVDAACKCGAWIIWGSLATDEDRADPRCGSFPFAARGVA